MSDASSNSPDDGPSEQPAGLLAQSSAPTDQRWTGSKPLKVTWTVLAASLVAVFAGGAIASGTPAEAVIVPIVVIPLAVAGCYRLWRTSIELISGSTLIVRNLLRTYHVPVAQIFSLRPSEYGIRITLIDGRLVTAGALQTGLRRQRRRPDQAGYAISAITQAVDAARSTQPAETAAAIDAGAPLRARRTIRRVVVTIVLGPAILIASFFVPAAGSNLDWRLRVLGVAYTLVSVVAAYSLLRVARKGTGNAYRRRRRR